MLAEKSAASAQPGVAVTANLRWAFILVTSLFFMWGGCPMACWTY